MATPNNILSVDEYDVRRIATNGLLLSMICVAMHRPHNVCADRNIVPSKAQLAKIFLYFSNFWEAELLSRCKQDCGDGIWAR